MGMNLVEILPSMGKFWLKSISLMWQDLLWEHIHIIHIGSAPPRNHLWRSFMFIVFLRNIYPFCRLVKYPYAIQMA